MLDPAILALLLVSLTVSLLLLPAAGFAIQVARHWDLSSSSERQLALERRTYLIATLLTFIFIAESIALVLFVHTAESLSNRFVGAMCATGVLGVNPWGWPTLFLKIAVFFACAVWSILNRLDNQAPDYPLARIKYFLLLAIVPLVLGAAAIQLLYFLNMDRDIITSCCGSLFTPAGDGAAAEIAGIAPRTTLIAFYASGAAVLASGVRVLRTATSFDYDLLVNRLVTTTYKSANLRRRVLLRTATPWQRCGVWFAAAGALAFAAGLVAIVSVIALYIYEHPQHHCPFCILKAEYDFVGYWLYIPLFGATAFALGVGVISPWGRIETLKEAIIADTRRFALLALLLFISFYGVATWVMVRSNLTMIGIWW